MREIRFKAKGKDNGEWIEGYLFNNGYDGGEERFFVGHIIIDEYTGTADDEWDITGIDFAEVIPETVCQYTGLKDKDGQEIWENDIIEFRFDNDDCPFPNKDTKIRIGRVFFSNFRSSFAIAMGIGGSDYINNDIFKYVQNGNRVKVIGNIFDNPELLEVSHDKNN